MIEKLAEILKQQAIKKIFLVTGKKSYAFCGAKDKIDSLLQDYSVVHLTEVEPNPKITDVEKGIELFRKEQCDIVIGIGGGSVMDTAKAIAILATQEKNAVESVKDCEKILPRTIPLILIPTTAGTGSEATHFSVVYIGKAKYSLYHPSMIADYAILDPSLTINLPKAITASTGIDAFCQAVEAFWSVNSTEESRKFSSDAIKLLLPNIEKAVNNPDKEVREHMLQGSYLAGKAINIAKTTAAHAVSYPITSFFKVPHGHAVALTFPSFISFNNEVTDENCQDKRGVEFVKERMKELFEMMQVADSTAAKQKIEALIQITGLETTLSQLGIKQDNLNIIIENGFNPLRVKNNPRILTEQELRKILEAIL